MFISRPRIYIVCLAAYNAGIEHGQWILADQTFSSLQDAVENVIARSPVANAKEWVILDQKGFGTVRLSAEENLETVAKLAAFIAKEGELGAALAHELSDIDEAERILEENYRGAYKSKEDFAIQYFNDLSNIDELMTSYVDYKRFTSDIFDRSVFALDVEGETHVFSN